MKQRIVITSNCSWFVANFFAPTIKKLLLEHEVHVIATRDRHTEKLSQLGCRFHHIAVDRSGANPFIDIAMIIRLYKLINKLNPDCVLNFTPKLNIYSTLVCWLLNIRVISTIAGLGSIISESGIRSLIGRILLRITQPLTDHIVFQNEEDRHLYIERNYIQSSKTSRVKGIGIELERFPVTQSKSDDVVRFILFARMLRNKGVVDYIEAAALVDSHFTELRKQGYQTPKYEFALLGFVDESNPQGISLEQLQAWNKQTCIQYLGATDNVLSVVRDYDCVVLPSFYREGVPQCLIEACAMSKPIITTDNVGCRDTTDHGINGYITPINDVSALAETMRKMLKLSAQERALMGTKGREKAEKEFCHLNIASHYLQLLTPSKQTSDKRQTYHDQEVLIPSSRVRNPLSSSHQINAKGDDACRQQAPY